MLVCSSCHAPLPEGTARCPHCGPGSLVLLGGETAQPLAASADDPATSRLARALGPQYSVVRLVGRGGFAEVYEVMDRDLQRRLAVKVLRSDLPWGPATLSRFKQEARAIARLNHPNTVPIHFVGEGEGLVYYAMPYLEGRSLAELLRTEGPLSPDRALDLIEPILEALQHAHDHGLVHRDVKPDNILLEARTGRPLLLDFGIVKYLDGPAHLTESGFIVGTPLYMSPEQALGSRVDARADIYGIGTVLFQLLTGAPPYAGNDSQEIVARHLQDPVPVASLSREGIPAWLAGIVVRCMAKHPDDRYPTARALLEALRAARAGAPLPLPTPRPVPRPADEAPTERMPAAAPRRRRLTWAAGAVAVLLAAGGLRAALLPQPETALVVENRLTRRIALTLGDTGLMIGAGDSARIPLASGRPVEAHWAVVQPSSPAGTQLGGVVEGAIHADRARGEMRRVIAADAEEGVWIAPVVSNRAGRPLEAAVVASGDTTRCDCFIPPGATMHLGYYRGDGATAVLVRDSAGWTARLGPLEAERDSVSGVAEARVDSASLRPPGGRLRRKVPPRQPEAPGAPANPLGSFLPVR